MRILSELNDPMSARMADEALVMRARRGERDAFDHLVRRHFPRVYALLFRLSGNHEDAEDLAQECFVRAWGALERYRETGELGAWLARIAVHLAHDHHRGRGRRAAVVPVSEPTAPSTPEPSEALSERELARRLELAIERLPWRLRVALTLRVFEGLDYVEIARTSGVTTTTARTHVMRARRLLARWLGPLLEDRT